MRRSILPGHVWSHSSGPAAKHACYRPCIPVAGRFRVKRHSAFLRSQMPACVTARWSMSARRCHEGATMTAWSKQDLPGVAAVTQSPLLKELWAIGLGDPAWTRLEPQSVSGDPRPGAEARVADPLWMIGRQWQFGELEGENVGTPVAVHVRTRSLPVTAWAPGGELGGDVANW